MSKFIVEYCPNISEQAEKIIIENITPSMSSTEGDSHQYNLDVILYNLFRELSVDDKIVLQTLSADKVDYIEF